MKKTLTSLRRLTTSVLLLFAAAGLWAYDFQQNGIHYSTTSSNTVKVIIAANWNVNYQKYYGDIVIPEQLIESNVLYKVTEIDNNAFTHCDNLTSISLPASVTKVGNNAFENCWSLKTINTEHLTTIGDCAFAGCESLTSFSFSENPIAMGFGIFARSGIISITIPENVSFVEKNFFQDCTQLEEVVFQNNPNEIGYAMFSGCSKLQSIDIPTSVKRISEQAFYSSGLTSIKIPASVTTIGNSAFSASTSLTSVEIGEGVKKLDDYAFSMTSLDEIILPESLDSIGREAFGNTKIESVKMPANIKFLGKDALGGSIKSLYIQNLDRWIMAERGSAVLCNNPDSKIYLNNRPITRLTIPDGVTQVNDYAFANATCIRTVTFPESGITRIGIGAFVRCTSLTGAEIPEGVEVIATEAFGHCKMLSALSLPQSLREIHGEDWWQGRDGAFEGCDALTEIIIPDNVTFIGDMAFCYLGNVTSITLGKSVETLGQWAFGNCAITQIILPDALVYAKDDAFMGCSRLDSMFIGKSYKDGYGQDKARYIYCNALNAEKIGNFPNARVFTFGPDVQTIPSNFAGSSNMVELHSESPTPPYVSEGAFSSIDKETCILYVPKGCVEDYRMEYEWEDFKYILEEGTVPEVVLPFELSTVDEDFGENLHCYTMKIRGDKYLHLDADGRTVRCTAVSTVDTNDEAYLWCFTGSKSDGFTVYNLAAGPNKILWTGADTDGNNVLMKSKAEATGATTWHLLENGEGYSFKLFGSSTGYPNDYGGENGEGILKIWAAAEAVTDTGSCITFTPVDTPTGIEQLKSSPDSHPAIIYDLTGRRVKTPNKGIYISNGQKLILK